MLGRGSVALYGSRCVLLPSLIQDSKEEYMAVWPLRQLLAVGYQVLVSHDPGGER